MRYCVGKHVNLKHVVQSATILEYRVNFRKHFIASFHVCHIGLFLLLSVIKIRADTFVISLCECISAFQPLNEMSDLMLL